MRILLLSLLLPVFAFSQQTRTYLKINDASGMMIKGTVTARGYENAIEVTTLIADGTAKSGGKPTNTITLSMPVSGASGDLRRANAGNKALPTGEITSLVIGQTNQLSYTIRMEEITVVSISDALGCNGVMTTTVVLSAARMGWTYYTTSRSGVSIVGSKYGWDARTNREWTGF